MIGEISETLHQQLLLSKQHQNPSRRSRSLLDKRNRMQLSRMKVQKTRPTHITSTSKISCKTQMRKMMMVSERSMTIRRKSQRRSRRQVRLLCSHKIERMTTLEMRLVLLSLTSQRTLKIAMVTVIGQALKTILMRKRRQIIQKKQQLRLIKIQKKTMISVILMTLIRVKQKIAKSQLKLMLMTGGTLETSTKIKMSMRIIKVMRRMTIGVTLERQITKLIIMQKRLKIIKVKKLRTLMIGVGSIARILQLKFPQKSLKILRMKKIKKKPKTYLMTFKLSKQQLCLLVKILSKSKLKAPRRWFKM